MLQVIQYLEQCHHARLSLSSFCPLFVKRKISKPKLPARQALNTALKRKIVIVQLEKTVAKVIGIPYSLMDFLDTRSGPRNLSRPQVAGW